MSTITGICAMAKLEVVMIAKLFFLVCQILVLMRCIRLSFYRVWTLGVSTIVMASNCSTFHSLACLAWPCTNLQNEPLSFMHGRRNMRQQLMHVFEDNSTGRTVDIAEFGLLANAKPTLTMRYIYIYIYMCVPRCHPGPVGRNSTM